MSMYVRVIDMTTRWTGFTDMIQYDQTDKLGFFGNAPIAQPADADQSPVLIPDAFTNVDGDFEQWVFGSYVTGVQGIEIVAECEKLADDCRNLRSEVVTYVTLLNEIRSALTALGIIKGSA